MKIKILFIVILFSSRIAISQTFILGAISGYGRGYTDTGPNFRSLFDDYTNCFNLGFTASYKPPKPILSYYTGLLYKLFYDKNYHEGLITLPLGLDFIVGKKYQLIFGAGMFGQYFLKSSQTRKRFDFGFNADIGFNYLINEKYSVFVKVMKDYGMTMLFEQNTSKTGGYTPMTWEDYYLYGSNINFGFNFYIKNKKTEIKQ